MAASIQCVGGNRGSRRRQKHHRRGAIVVLAAFLMVVMLGMVAFAIDIGYLLVARTELQRSADAAAVAAAWRLADMDESYILQGLARTTATQYVSANNVLQGSPNVDWNGGNSLDGDIVVGTIDDFGNPDAPFYTGDPANYNAVQVRVRRSSDRNGEVPFFFASVMRHDGAETEATATAALMKRISGFRAPESGENLPILPIALHVDAWNNLLVGNTQDDWSYDAESGSVEPGSDGIPEVLLFPESTESAGNFGTVDIGTSSNSTDHLSLQILSGVTEADLAYHGGELKIDDSGKLWLTGNTGISTGIKDALEAILAEKRIIPVFQEVVGQGTNATYSIVKFVGVRIMKVELAAGEKGLFVQPANVVTSGTIPTDSNGTSDYVYSPAHLVK